MLLLQKNGYGVEQGIPTLLMAAGSFDDVLAITGFTTCLGVAFATGIPSTQGGYTLVPVCCFRAHLMVRCLGCWLKAPPGTTC